MFWTDATQAQERLTNSVLCYDKKPVYIDRIDGEGALVIPLEGSSKVKKVSLEDEKWNNFRDLPKLGWMNYVHNDKVSPVFLERRAINSRSHGLTTQNTCAYLLSSDGLSKEKYGSFTEYLKNPGYHETLEDEAAYPKLSEILMALGDTPSGIAFSSKFCAIVTSEGMKWLFRKTRRIGFFTGTDSLNLFPKNGYYKEELEACPSFDINNIREF